MTPKLSDDLQKALDANAGQPTKVEHPGTHKLYVIVDNETHEQAMEALRKQQDHDAIQAGVDAMEADRTIPLAEADQQIRQELDEFDIRSTYPLQQQVAKGAWSHPDDAAYDNYDAHRSDA